MDRPYEDGSMYIILTAIDAATNRYHWGIFLCVSGNFGIVYHVTNTAKTNDTWKFEDYMTENVVDSRSIVAALQIGTSLHNAEADAVHKLLVDVPVIEDGSLDARWNEKFTCRVWILEALDCLRRDKLIPDEAPRDVEDDAFRLAQSAVSNGTRKMGKSRAIRRIGR